MALTVIKFKRPLARVVLIAAAGVCLLVAWFFVKWNFANTIAARMDTSTFGADRVAEWLIQAAPSDPQTHLTAALVYESTFDPADLARSLNEYERAAALSPNDYLRWLDLGKARGLSGNDDGAREAYARAMELAPNYATVQWAYGNALVRAGRLDEGFALISSAAQANSDYANPAVTTALQIYDGDTARVRHVLGDVDGTNAALAAIMASQKRFDEALDNWSTISPSSRADKFKPLASSLIDQMVIAKKFRPAVRIAANLQPNEAEKPAIGQVENGGFESGVKLRNAGFFEWQIAEGAQPQVGLVEGDAHSGRYSLFALFNTFASANFRNISQTVAVEPGVEYELELFYKYDLKTSSSLRWEVADAVTTQTIAGTPIMAPAADWTPLKARFTVPTGIDGVIIRLARGGCAGPACQMSGRLAFDDISLRRL